MILGDNWLHVISGYIFIIWFYIFNWCIY